jgi:hypothetical protein
LVCDEVHVDGPGIVDVPNVVVDEATATVRICGSEGWKSVRALAGAFVGILSHESIHFALLGIDAMSSDRLDNVASLSVISRSLRDISLVSKYSHGMIGFNL